MAVAHPDLVDVGEEDCGTSKSVYLVTLPHPRVDRSIDGTVLRAPGSISREELRDFFLQALAALQAARARPLIFKRMAIFQEKHGSGNVHYHVAVLADRCFRFLPFKRMLLVQHGLASHWSCSHDFYATCIAYGYVPSPSKPLEECDPTPLLWAPPGSEHPPLAEASRLPATAAALAERREQARRAKAQAGRSDKFKALDLWPIVVRENITVDVPGCAEKVLAYARRCGGPAMVEFCFNNYAKLEDLVHRSWQMEQVEDILEGIEKPRVQFLHEAAQSPCKCQRRWVPAAMQLFALNGINPSDWCSAVWASIHHGRSKGSLVCHAGKEGDEGKSFLFEPLYAVFGADSVFTAPPKNAFPLLELPKARLALLDDWRFNEDVVSYALQLLWFEGKPFVIARPQNQFTGHVRYHKDDPVFITTLEADLMALRAKVLPGDRDMMLKRLKIFRFQRKLENPQRDLPACGHCFARLLLTHAGGSPGRADPIVLPVAETSKPVPEWSTEDVAEYLAHLGFHEHVHAFMENGVDGQMLLTLSENDIVGELGLTRLQSRKVLQRLNVMAA